jgi:hypothetical protein
MKRMKKKLERDLMELSDYWININLNTFLSCKSFPGSNILLHTNQFYCFIIHAGSKIKFSYS